MAMQRISMGTILAVAVTATFMSVLAASLLAVNQRIPNAGNVKAVGVGVYWNSNGTSNVTSIDWGFLEPGATANKTVYIKNEGNTRVILNMTTSSWSTGAYGKITLIWNLEGYLLDSSAIVQTTLTLSVSSNITGVTSFSFDIIITGTEYA